MTLNVLGLNSETHFLAMPINKTRVFDVEGEKKNEKFIEIKHNSKAADKIFPQIKVSQALLGKFWFGKIWSAH